MIADKNGRPYAKLSELQVDDPIEIDGGFTCAIAGRQYVRKDGARLYFKCRDGHHYLDAQADDGVHCTGVYRAN